MLVAMLPMAKAMSVKSTADSSSLALQTDPEFRLYRFGHHSI